MNISCTSAFIFFLILFAFVATVAFFKSKNQGASVGNALLESGIWGVSLIAVAGGDYLLISLNSNHLWA